MKCPLCEKEIAPAHIYVLESTKSIGEKEYSYLECENCGVLFVNPMPSEEVLNDIYSELWYEEQTEKNAVWSVLQTALSIWVCKARSRYAAHSKKKPGKILDIGCGTGSFLREMARRGWDVYGNEINKTAFFEAQTRVGKERVFSRSLEECGFPGNHFDAVTLWHVLEHLRSPQESLAEIYRVLKKDGILIAEIPNVRSLSLRMFKEKYSIISYYAPEHLYYWSNDAFRLLLARCGYSVRETTYPMASPTPLELSKSIRNFLAPKLGTLAAKIGFLVLMPLSVVNNFVGNYVFGSGEVVRFKAQKD